MVFYFKLFFYKIGASLIQHEPTLKIPMFYKKEIDVANIQYVGKDGITINCIKAAALILSSGYLFQHAALITNNQRHLFILKTEEDYFVIKNGFTSGYRGEGPRGLAITLILLQQHKLDIDEYEISNNLWVKLVNMEIDNNEIENLLTSSPIRPQRWYDYIYNAGLSEISHQTTLSKYYPMAIPLALVDERIIDLAITFSGNPDYALTTAYRRLEEIIRKRSDMAGEGAKLFASVFLIEKQKDKYNNHPILTWNCPDNGEIKGRGNLFGAVYMAFRNARMHRELKTSFVAELREFMLINELFNLEREAIKPSLAGG